MGISFLLDGTTVTLDDVDPTATLLDHLRYRMGRTGTKEGCAEGDCGACTILVGSVDATGDAVAWRALNSCITFLPMVNGKNVMTVESLAAAGDLNPLQACMAANGSSQCGFCTPGFVMSLYGRCVGASGYDLPVADVIAGNLCRCTGYGPIIAAGERASPLPRDDAALAKALKSIKSAPMSGRYGDRSWFAPQTCEALAELLGEHPEARIVAGATDVGLWVTKGLQTIEKLIFIGDIEELRTIDESTDGLRLGAGVPYADAHAAFARLHPDLGELTRRIGGLQVRNAGTIGGNIANGSPIGDGPPALIALGAQMTLRSMTGIRTIALEDYFLGYGKQDRKPEEFVESIWIPRPGEHDIIHISKLSRRFDSDISAVCGAFNLTVERDRIVAARVAFGGMAATPRRATGCEAALAGRPFTFETIEGAVAALRADFTPLSDVRGSSGYRLDSAANLLLRLWYRAQGETVSVLDMHRAHG